MNKEEFLSKIVEWVEKSADKIGANVPEIVQNYANYGIISNLIGMVFFGVISVFLYSYLRKGKGDYEFPFIILVISSFLLCLCLNEALKAYFCPVVFFISGLK